MKSLDDAIAFGVTPHGNDGLKPRVQSLCQCPQQADVVCLRKLTLRDAATVGFEYLKAVPVGGLMTRLNDVETMAKITATLLAVILV